MWNVSVIVGRTEKPANCRVLPAVRLPCSEFESEFRAEPGDGGDVRPGLSRLNVRDSLTAYAGQDGKLRQGQATPAPGRPRKVVKRTPRRLTRLREAERERREAWRAKQAAEALSLVIFDEPDPPGDEPPPAA